MAKINFEREEQLGIITFMDKPLNLIDSIFIEELGVIKRKLYEWITRI
ncbi:MAG: hypothetical protein ACFFKA_16500 [Candidatus Thorarchaeota archaeon]